MRAHHAVHLLPSFPIYSSAFLSHNELVLGGGGGTSRSGVKNRLRLYRVIDPRNIEPVNELDLEQDEDAPMSMDAHLETKNFVCGINSSTEKLEQGVNENCRLYRMKDSKLALVRTQGTLSIRADDDYQKVTSISPDGKFLAAAGAQDFSLLNYPSLSPATNPIHIEKGSIYDATFSPLTLVLTTTVNMLVYALPEIDTSKRKGKGKGKGPQKDLKLLRSVELPKLPGDLVWTFRAARFHPGDPHILYTVVNASHRIQRMVRNPPRPSFLCRWDAENWTVVKQRKVCDRGLTCFDVSPDGKFLAYGSSDCTIGLLDATTLAPLLTILKAHDFPTTTISFNANSSLFVSGSADNSLRIVEIPNQLGATSWKLVVAIIFALLVLLLAVFLQAFSKL